MPVIKVCGRFVSYGDGKWPQDLIMIMIMIMVMVMVMVIGSSGHRVIGSSERRRWVRCMRGCAGCAGCAGVCRVCWMCWAEDGAERLVTGRSGGTSDLDRADGDHCMGTREGPGDR